MKGEPDMVALYERLYVQSYRPTQESWVTVNYAKMLSVQGSIRVAVT